MKARKVVVTMEVSTDAKLKDLRDGSNWRVVFLMGDVFDVQQRQVNVIQPAKEAKKKK